MPRSTAASPPQASRLSVICNPRSGRVAKQKDAVRRLGRELAGSRYREAANPGDVGEVLEELPVEVGDTLCVVGGDGTVGAVLTALHSRRPQGPWPVLAPVPGGMTNMTAYDLGVRRSLPDTLRWLHRVRAGEATEGTVVQHAVLAVRRPGGDRVCGMFFGVGTVSDGVRFFQQRLRKLRVAGEHNSGVAIARVLLSLALHASKPDFRGVEITSALDGGPAERRSCLLCLVSTLNRHVLGTRPYWGREDAPLHFTRVDRGADAFWRSLPRLARGRPSTRMTSERGWTSHNASRVELTFDGPFVLDGEIYEAGPTRGPCVLSVPHTPRWLVP